MVVEVSNFEQEVIQRSYERPVLVDFWAPWCGPCRLLGPVLEKLASENGDSWTLAKLNTDENPDVAARYGIRSIPAVKLFVDGQVTDEFLGALPEASVRQWLEKAVPSPQRRLIEAAGAALAAGERDTAGQLVDSLLASQPRQPEAMVLKAALLALSQPLEALRLVREAHSVDVSLYNLREAVVSLGQLHERAGAGSLPESPARQPLLDGLAAQARGDIDAALQAFVNAVRLDRRYEDDAARRACIALFALLGDHDPLTKKHRRALEMALF